MNHFDEVIERTDIVRYITNATGKIAKKEGACYKLEVCPFCESKKGFKIWESIQAFKCFACDAKGNVVNFVRRYDSASSNWEALKIVAESIGYVIKETGEGKEKFESDQVRQNIFNEAAAFYHETLLTDTKALKILNQTRKYTKRTVKEFGIGYTGNSPNLLLKHLKGQYTDEQLIQSGLVKIRKGKPSDFFIPQLFIFPHNKGNNTCDFTIKDALKHVKKKNGGDIINYRLATEYRLRNVVFYNQDAFYSERVYITEGEHDAIQLMRAQQEKNTIAICGNLSQHQKNYLRKALEGREVYLVMDRDPTGEKYIREIFDLVWGKCRLYVVYWERQDSAAEDIDDYLRGFEKMDEAMDYLTKKQQEAFRYLLYYQVSDSEDVHKLMDQMKPLVDRMLKCENKDLVDLSMAEIRQRFENHAICKIIEKRLNEQAFLQAKSGASSQYLPYFEEDCIYFRKQRKGDVGLSNFVLRIQDIIRMDDEIYYRCKLINDQGEITDDVLFDADDRTNRKRFARRCASKGSYYFTGGDSDLAGIWQLEESRQTMNKTFYVQHYGYVKQEDMWLFENCAIKSGSIYKKNERGFIEIDKRNYKSFDVMVYSGATPNLNLDTEYTQEFAQRTADNFHTVLDANSSGKLDGCKGYLFFGFLPATLYSLDIYEKFGFFPFPFAYGPSGTGKTSVTNLLLSCFGFFAGPESWPSATKDGTHKLVQCLGSLPCWYDEFLNDETFKLLFNTVKNIYNRVGSGKGGLTKRQIQEVNGCLWLSGEDNPANEALLSRSVIFRFDPINEHKNVGFQQLTEDRRHLSAITRQIILEKNRERVEHFYKTAEVYAAYIMERAEKMDYRVAMNHALPAAGLDILNINVPEGFLDYLTKHAERGYAHKLTESPIYQFFSELTYLYNRGNSLNQSVRYDEVEDELYVHFSSAIKVIQREMRTRGDTLKVKADSIKDYLTDLDACIELSRRTHMTQKIYQRCMVFEVGKLPEQIRDLSEMRAHFDENSVHA